MKRSLTVMLMSLALLGGLADAARRSGGGFGGSRSLPRSSPYSAPRTTFPRPAPPQALPQNNSAGSAYTAPRSSSRAPSAAQRSAALPSTASVRNTPANRSALSRVTPSQLSAWRSAPLPPGVPRNALIYSATKSSAYQYQLQNGRYYPYPQSYYRNNGIGSSLFKYALIFMAVDAVTDAAALNRPVNGTALSPEVGGSGDLSDVPANPPVVAPPAQGPNVWGYAGVGLLAAGAAWFTFGRRKSTPRR
ncbi:hypothetical protein [Deinococcus koreensis]|uniref:MprA protease, GlyGly-CTERM protein-sorting domain-containing form n=1 Tax=Deinococcus koreensis TaxID=2054903 RepID=A0A2K3UUN7_9DEIO|nr:hypothetical protein [Deinococcus koreensis]PNY80256.1 hypothetical protein CVO96_01765 [Deinococcus koreensis]